MRISDWSSDVCSSDLLLHAIGGAFAAEHPDATILYMSAEKFMYEFVTAMRANETMAFKARLRSAEMLLIDDIQFIAGKGSTQRSEEHTSELQSLMRISYAVFCLKKKNHKNPQQMMK